MTQHHLENKIKSNASTLFYGILLSTSGMFFGFGVGFFNTYFEPFIENVYNINDENEKISISGNLNFFFLLGGIISCLTAGSICELIGRYKSLIGLTILGILSTSCCWIKNLYLLYFLRCVNGWISCSWTFVAPLIIKENIPVKFKNFLGLFFYIFLTLGILIAYSFDSVYFALKWRYVIAIPLLTEIPKLFLYGFLYRMESPVWISNKFFDDKKILKEKLQKNYLYLYNETNSEKMANHFIDERDRIEGEKQTVTFSELFSKQFRKQFFLGIFLNFLNQMTGINFLIFYSTKIFETLELSNPSLLTFFFGFLNFVGAIFVATVSSKFKKKQCLVAGLFLQSLAYFIFLLGYITEIGFFVVLGAYLFIFSFAFSIGGSLYPYLAEILPPIGIAFSSIIQWLLAIIIGKYAIVIIQNLGIFFVFFGFMVISLVGAIFVAGYGVHTKGRHDFQIQKDFMEKKFMV